MVNQIVVERASDTQWNCIGHVMRQSRAKIWWVSCPSKAILPVKNIHPMKMPVKWHIKFKFLFSCERTLNFISVKWHAKILFSMSWCIYICIYIPHVNVCMYYEVYIVLYYMFLYNTIKIISHNNAIYCKIHRIVSPQNSLSLASGLYFYL